MAQININYRHDYLPSYKMVIFHFYQRLDEGFVSHGGTPGTPNHPRQGMRVSYISNGILPYSYEYYWEIRINHGNIP
jgi:hypothetical protein